MIGSKRLKGYKPLSGLFGGGHSDEVDDAIELESDLATYDKAYKKNNRLARDGRQGSFYNNGDDGDINGDGYSSSESDGTEHAIFVDRPRISSRKAYRRRAFWRHCLLFGTVGIFILAVGVFIYRPKHWANSRRPTDSSKPVFSNGTHEFYKTTIVVSLDGFHPHFINSDLTPRLQQWSEEASMAPFMRPSFPSVTFPNHYTLATGLRPAHHGIVGNIFYDPATDEYFDYTKHEITRHRHWWGGEPIWSTAMRQNVLSAVHMWPGSNADWAPDEHPAVVDPFNAETKLSEKLDRLLGWINMPNVRDRPELLMMYVPLIDALGHLYGIRHERINQGLQRVDDFLGDLRDAIAARNLTDIINLVVVSDHGMAPIGNDRLIFLDDIMVPSTIEYDRIEGRPLVGLRPRNELQVDDLYDHLVEVHSASTVTDADADADEQAPHWNVYLKEDLPDEWQFGGERPSIYDDRIAPVWIIPATGWAVTTHDRFKDAEFDYKPKGLHGYNNSDVLMRAIFLADGPFFKSLDYNKFEPFDNVDVYNIICATLDLQTAPNDGISQLYSPDNESLDQPFLLQPLSNDWQDFQQYPGLEFENYMKGPIPTDGLGDVDVEDLVTLANHGDTGDSAEDEEREDEEHEKEEDHEHHPHHDEDNPEKGSDENQSAKGGLLESVENAWDAVRGWFGGNSKSDNNDSD